MKMKRAVLPAIITALLVAGGLLARPDTAGEGPGGTLALRRFLSEMDLDVKSSATLPRIPLERSALTPGTYVLLEDIRDEGEVRAMLRWVKAGGRLLVADPGSGIVRQLGAGESKVVSPLGAGRKLQPGCPELRRAQVGSIYVSGTDKVFADPPARSVQCFRTPEGPFMLSVPHGAGSAVLLGGYSPFSNEMLRRRQNAMFAFRLFAGFGPVVFGPPASPSALATPRGPWQSLPSPAKAAIIQLLVAGAVFAFVRGRRFGRPVIEEPISPIPSSQLVTATADLYRSAGAADFAGRLLRRAARHRLALRMGTAPSDERALASALAEYSELEQGEAVVLLSGPDPQTDLELIELAARLEQAEQRLAKI